MSSVGYLGDRKGLHQLTMHDVEIHVVDGVIVSSRYRVLYCIDYRGVHHNNPRHIHGCDHGICYSGGHRNTTFCLRGGVGDIIRETKGSTVGKASNKLGSRREDIVDTWFSG